MNLIEVNPVCSQSTQRIFNSLQDVATGVALIVGVIREWVVDFGRQIDLVSCADCEGFADDADVST